MLSGWHHAVALALLSACGGSAPGPADASMPPDAPTMADAAGPPAPAMPAPPAPPDLRPCPEGWVERTIGEGPEFRVCEPWPTDWPGCPEGWLRVPGQPDCTPSGLPCPAGDFADDLPATDVWYVRAGADPGGDGSPDAPFGSIAEAAAVAMPGHTIAVARGSYDESVVVPNGVALRGACTAETEIHPSVPGPGGSAALWLAEGAAASDLTVRGERPGVRPQAGATGTIRRIYVAQSVFFGLVATEGATLVGDSVLVENPRPGADVGLGHGAVVNGSARLQLHASVVRGASTSGIIAFEEGSEVELVDVAIRHTHSDLDGGLGSGLTLSRDVSASLRRVIIEHSRGSGIYADFDSALDAADLVIRHVRAQEVDGVGGTGLGVAGGAQATLRRVFVEDGRLAGLFAIGFRTTLDVEDAVIADIDVQQSNGRDGAAVGVVDAATAIVRRAACLRSSAAAIAVDGTETVATLEDIHVLSTRPQLDGVGGRGISIQAGAHAEITRAHLTDNYEVGLLAQGAGSTVTAMDVLIERTMSRPFDEGPGRALSAEFGGVVHVDRGRFDRNQEVSVLSLGEGSSISLTEVVVRETLPRSCAATTCPTLGAGTGVAAAAGGLIDVDRFVVTLHSAAGLQMARGGRVTARNGEVSHNPVGVNIQDVVPDLADLSDNVIYRDNGVNLDSSALPVPDATTGP